MKELDIAKAQKSLQRKWKTGIKYYFLHQARALSFKTSCSR